MSFASCSTRFESSPERTSDVGLQVESARTTTSSPELTRSTGAPAASYHPQATVFGVGMSECNLPGPGAGQSVRGVASAQTRYPPLAIPGLGFAAVPTDDGVRQLSASTPLMTTLTPIRCLVIRRLLRRPESLRRSTCFSAFAH